MALTGVYRGDGWRIVRRRPTKSDRRKGRGVCGCGARAEWLWGGKPLPGEPTPMCEACDTEYLDGLIELFGRPPEYFQSLA